MGELLTIAWPSHHQQLSEGLWNLFLENVETDFALEVKNSNEDRQLQQSIKAHYLLLAVFCPKIKPLNNEKRYKLVSEIDADCLKCLMEFIYRGKVEVDEEKILLLKFAAEQLGFKTLVDLIEKCTRGLRKAANKKDLVEKLLSKRKTKTPVKIPQFSNPTSTRQQRKRKIKDKKYFQSSTEEKEDEEAETSEDSDKDFLPDEDNDRINEKTSKKDHSNNKTATILSENTRSSSPPLDPFPPAFNADQLLCTICDKKFKTRQTFRQHMRRHTYPDVVQQCPHCPFKAYNFKSKLFYHLASKHQMDLQGNLLEKSFKCPDCDFACVAEFQLKSHKIYKHSAKIHKCDVCSYASNSRADLRKHQDGVHGNKRPFMCETCGFAAKSSSNLHLHLSTHKEKVVCEICGVTVKCRGLSLHMQTVHGENRKPFHCHLCSLATRCKFNLKVHLTRVHKLSADEVKNVLSKRNNLSFIQDCSSVFEAPVMSLEQTIDPNLNIPYLNFGSEQITGCNDRM